MLDLEIAGAVRSLTAEEAAERRTVAPVKRLRDSHFAVARCVAAGLSDIQTALQTGYAPNRVTFLRNDPTFRELVEHFRNTDEHTRLTFEHRMMMVSEDALQDLHEDLDAGVLTADQKIEVFKLTADRAGFAPVSRSISVTKSISIGDKMDAAHARLARTTKVA